jgi:cullin-associated NEDD8-dissociated protein 1
MVESRGGQSMDETLERRICQNFVGHLEDSSLDVSSNAVKCIQKVSGVIRESNLLMILEKLVDQILSAEKVETRDINSIAIRSSFNEVQESSAEKVIKTIQPKLQQGINNRDPVIKETCLEIMADMFKRFSITLAKNQTVVNKEDLMRKLPDLLMDKDPSIRKKSTLCIGAFAIVLGTRQLEHLLNQLFNSINSAGNKHETLTLIQCLCHMSRTVGQKLGQFLNTIIPHLETTFKFLTEQSTPIDNEIVEASLSTLENLIKRCPKEISDHVDKILNHAMALISYDPNYSYVDEADQNMEEDDGEGWGSDYSEENMGGGDDDDDVAWKVRQAAARSIEALIKSRPELLKEFYKSQSRVLVDRIKERDDNVKVCILSTVSTMLRSTILSESTDDSEMVQSLQNNPSLSRQRSFTDQLSEIVPDIVKQLLKQFDSKN